MPSVQEFDIDIAAYLDALLEGRYLILASIASMLLLGFAYLYVAAPVYESDVLLQLIDQQDGTTALEDISGLLTTDKASADAEMEIIQSRRILGDTVDRLNLDFYVEPETTPLIGPVLARKRHQQKGMSNAMSSRWGGGEYVWETGSLKIDEFTVGTRYINQKLKLSLTSDKEFELANPSGKVVVTGTVGAPEASSNKSTSPNNQLSIKVSEFDAATGRVFTLTRYSSLETINELKRQLVIEQIGPGTGVIKVSMQGNEPRHIARILNTLLDIYQSYDTNKKTEKTQQMISFIESESPIYRERLEDAERAFAEYLAKNQSVGIDQEVTKLLDKLSQSESQILTLELQKVEKAKLYTADHPAIVTLQNQITFLTNQREGIDRQLALLPQTEREKAILLRNIEVTKELFLLLQSKTQELEIALSGINSDIQIIDRAHLADKPVRPSRILVIMGSILLGLVLGIVIVVIRRAVINTVEDPGIIENELHIPVYGVISYSPEQAELQKTGGMPGSLLLSTKSPYDNAVEGLRSLRTRLRFAHADGQQVIAITGPAPNAGKSFVSANLAKLLADLDMKIMLIDGDLRRGALGKTLAIDGNLGLTDLLAGSATHDDVRHTIAEGTISFDFISSGTRMRNCTDLLMSRQFNDLMSDLRADYDLVVIDTAPATLVTDGVIIGQLADVNLMVVRYREQNRREISVARDTLASAGVTVDGVVFNSMISKSRYGYRYGYGYGYKYGYRYGDS